MSHHLARSSSGYDRSIDAQAAAAWALDELVVIGSRGRSAVRGMFLGSVSQRLLRDSACPVASAHARTV